MKLACNKCSEVLTIDMYKVKVKRDQHKYITNIKAIFELKEPEMFMSDPLALVKGNMKGGLFYISRCWAKYNNRWDEDRPAQIIPKRKPMIVVGKPSVILPIPPMPNGYGCCDWSNGAPLRCKCGNHVADMYIDCYEHGQIFFHQNKVTRIYN